MFNKHFPVLKSNGGLIEKKIHQKVRGDTNYTTNAWFVIYRLHHHGARYTFGIRDEYYKRDVIDEIKRMRK